MSDSEIEETANPEYTTLNEQPANVEMEEAKEEPVVVKEDAQEKCILLETCDGHIVPLPITRAKKFDTLKQFLDQEDFDLSIKWPLYQFDSRDKKAGTAIRMKNKNDMTKEDLDVILRLEEICTQAEGRYIVEQMSKTPKSPPAPSISDGKSAQTVKVSTHSSSNDAASEDESDTQTTKAIRVGTATEPPAAKPDPPKEKSASEIIMLKKWPTYERDIEIINAAKSVLRDKGITGCGFTLSELARLTETTKYLLHEIGYRYVIASLSAEMESQKWEANLKRMKEQIEKVKVTDDDIKKIGEKIPYLQQVLNLA